MSVFISVISTLFSILVLVYWSNNPTVFNSAVFGLIYFSLAIYLFYFIWTEKKVSFFGIADIVLNNIYMRIYFILLLALTIVISMILYFTKSFNSIQQCHCCLKNNISGCSFPASC